MSDEDESMAEESEQEESVEEVRKPEPLALAEEPPLSDKKRKRLEAYDGNEMQTKRMKREIKRMISQNPDMRKAVGQNTELDTELDGLTPQELKEWREDCYIFLNKGNYDILSTGRSLVNLFGRGIEKFTHIPGYASRVTADDRLVTMVHENLPFDPAQFGPYVEILSSLVSHGVNLYHEWTTPATLNASSTSSNTPPVS